MRSEFRILFFILAIIVLLTGAIVTLKMTGHYDGIQENVVTFLTPYDENKTETECKSPNVIVYGECCVDKNNNKVCDDSEIDPSDRIDDEMMDW